MNNIPYNCYICNILLSGYIDSINDKEYHYYNSPIVLVCNCMISICRLCALKQLALSNDTYSSPKICPCCNQKTNQAIQDNGNDVLYCRGYCNNCNDNKVEECSRKDCPIAIENSLIDEISNVRRSSRNKSKYNTTRTEELFQDHFSEYKSLMNIITNYSIPAQRLALTRLYLDQKKNINTTTFDVLPLGPLEHVQLYTDTYLQKAIDYNNQKTKELEKPNCFICQSDENDIDVNPDSLLIIKQQCNCSVICKQCYLQIISSKPYTYENILGPCAVCHCYVIDKNVNKLCQEEEDNLIDEICNEYDVGKKDLVKLYFLLVLNLLGVDSKNMKNLSNDQLGQEYIRSACKSYRHTREWKGLFKNEMKAKIEEMDNTIQKYFQNKDQSQITTTLLTTLLEELNINDSFITQIGILYHHHHHHHRHHHRHHHHLYNNHYFYR